MGRFTTFFSEYSIASKIHGVFYLCHPRSSRAELIFWACSLIASATILFSLIFLTAEKFLSYDTIITRTDFGIPISHAPFPAITICPDSLVFEKIFEYQNKSLSGNFTEEDLAAYQVLDLLYDQNYLPTNFSTQSLVKTLEKYFQNDWFDNDNSFYWHRVRGVPFSRILTKWGLCFNFNLVPFESLLNEKSVSKDFNYQPPSWYKNSKGRELPWKSPGNDNGFCLLESLRERILYNDKNMFRPLKGYHIIVHNSDELPYRTGFHVFHGNFDDDTVYVLAQPTLIDKDLEAWKPEQRNCFMIGEKKLKYFRIYTKANCEHECLSKAMLDSCGCVPFYMIRSSSDRICGVWDRSCYVAVEEHFDISSKCQCLSSCVQMNYEFGFDRQRKRDYRILFVKYAVNALQPLIRKKIVRLLEAIEYAGGLMALLCGLSIVSIVQLFWGLLRFMVVWRKSDAKGTTTIPRAGTQCEFNFFTRKLYHLKNDLDEFFKKSSIHGIHNLTGSFKAKVFWMSVISVAAAACVHSIRDLMDDFGLNQVLVEIDANAWSVHEIPFPAVTYCPELNKTLLEQHIECRLRGHCSGLNSSQISTNINALEAGCNVCYSMAYIRRDIEKAFRRELILTDFRNNTHSDYLKTYLDPSWIDRQSFCKSGETDSELIETLAFQGSLCYTINGLKGMFNEKNTASDFLQNFSLKSTCKHEQLSMNRGLKIVLQDTRAKNSGWLPTNPPDINQRYNCRSDLGSVSIHHPGESPYSFELIQHGQSYSLVIEPLIIRSDESIRRIPPKLRNCYFEDERKLQYFSKYTRQNCLSECLSLVVEQSCHCVPFSYPRHPNLRICIDEAALCISITEGALNDGTSSKFKMCDCLDLCNTIIYSYDLKINNISPKHLQNYSSSGDFVVESEISVYFGNSEYLGNRRFSRFHAASFLSKFGAILWIFSGASFLSIVEVIYFFTVRVFNNFWI